MVTNKDIAHVGSCECGRWKGLTLPSMYSSHWSPRLVTILGVPSSTGRMSTWKCWGAAVITCVGSQKRKVIIHRYLKYVRSYDPQSWNPWNLLALQNGQPRQSPLLITLGMRHKECRSIKRGQYEKKSKKQVALFCNFTCYGNWLLHTHAFLNWVQFCPEAKPQTIFSFE